MRVSPDNIFPGAKVEYNGKTMYVIKVNAKSFYCADIPFSEVIEKYNGRIKGTTFVKFCKENNILSYKYTDSFSIEENEFSRKAVAEANSTKKYELGKAVELAIADVIKELDKKKKSCQFIQIEVAKQKIRFLERNGNCFLINAEGDYILYDLDNAECIKISTVYDYNFKEVPWEKLSVFSKVAVIA